MSENKTSDAQLKASKKYNKANRKALNIKDRKRRGLKFIEENASLEDLKEYEKAIETRKNELKELTFNANKL